MHDLYARLAPIARRPRQAAGGVRPAVSAGIALAVALAAVLTIAPSPVLGAVALAPRCDVNLRARPSTTSRVVRGLNAGTQVTAGAKVSGGRWSTPCAGDRESGSGWWKIVAINGRSVRSLLGREVVYAAAGLFRGVIRTGHEAACDGVALRSRPGTGAGLKTRIREGTDVTTIGSVTGGTWSVACDGRSAGTSWLLVSHVNGRGVKSLYGVDYVYGARGLFREAKPTAPDPVPTEWSEGIDVSHWQGTINWARVAGAGKRFAYLKATEASRYVDPTYRTNRSQAKANGLRVGAYHYARPEPRSGDAVREANHFIDTARPTSGELVPVLDLEETGGMGVRDLTAWTRAFLQRVYERTGVRAAIYVSPRFWANRMGNSTWFAANGYRILWVAHWTSARSPALPASNWGGNGWTFWQYTSAGKVSGISGPVDLNRYRSRYFRPVLIP